MYKQKKEEQKQNEIVFFGIGTLGLGLIVTVIVFLGLGFLAVSLPKFLNWDNQSWKTNLSLNVGTAFFASAILTCTLEIASQNQRRKDFQKTMDEVNKKIQEIREASVDQLLEDLAGDKAIFQELKGQILKKNYIRRAFKYQIRLNWLEEEDKRYLKKEQQSSYIIVNLSSKPVTYKLQVIEEKEYCDLPKYKDSTKILNINYETFNSENPYSVKADCKEIDDEEIKINIQENKKKYENIYGKKIYDFIEFSREIIIPPNYSLKVETKVETIVNSQLRYPLISLVNSTSFEIDITYHPRDLMVVCYPITPNFEKLEVLASDFYTKRWKINTGILPGQGVQLEWKPEPLDEKQKPSV